MNCPTCGRPASGKFCSECGAALAGAACGSCGAPLSPGGKFCHLCGTPHTTRPAAARPPGNLIGWVVGAAAVVILIVVLVSRVSGPAAPATGAAPPGMGGAAPAIDLSSMTPREQADRLFDRVMQASSQGDSSQVSFFTPMALQTYGTLDGLDADARYHVGLLEIEAANFPAALAQADTLQQLSPGHLFVMLVRGEAARRSGDAAALRRAYRSFLDTADQEEATGKQEYAAHQRALDAFRDAARAALGSAR